MKHQQCDLIKFDNYYKFIIILHKSDYSGSTLCLAPNGHYSKSHTVLLFIVGSGKRSPTRFGCTSRASSFERWCWRPCSGAGRAWALNYNGLGVISVSKIAFYALLRSVTFLGNSDTAFKCLTLRVPLSQFGDRGPTWGVLPSSASVNGGRVLFNPWLALSLSGGCGRRTYLRPCLSVAAFTLLGLKEVSRFCSCEATSGSFKSRDCELD